VKERVSVRVRGENEVIDLNITHSHVYKYWHTDAHLVSHPKN
jgi:hypothetical protein